jgi:hypothetical protein
VNEAILQFLRAGAQPAKSQFSRSDARLSGWELRCHPDLAERFEEAADRWTTPVYMYGLPVLVHPNGIAFAVATGTSFVLLRLPRAMRDDLERSNWDPEGLDDPDWVDVEPWLDLPGAEARFRLAQWISRASEHAGSLEMG